MDKVLATQGRGLEMGFPTTPTLRAGCWGMSVMPAVQCVQNQADKEAGSCLASQSSQAGELQVQ